MGQHYAVYAVGVFQCRSLAVVGSKNLLHELSVGEVPSNEDCYAYKKRNHVLPSYKKARLGKTGSCFLKIVKFGVVLVFFLGFLLHNLLFL